MNPCGASTSSFRDYRLSPSLATPASVVKSLIKPFFISLSIRVKLTVKLSRANEIKEIETNAGSTVGDVLKKLNLKPDTIIVMNKNKPIPIDDEIKDGEELTVLQVSSGG